MDETQVLTSVAELAIALAGFSGLVTVFRRRTDETWPPELRLRLTLLILSSFTAAAFAFLPLLLWEIVGSEHRVWRISSAGWSIFGVGFMVWARSRVARLRADDPEFEQRVSVGLFYVTAYVAFPLVVGLSLANAALWGAFTPYLVALVWGLVGAAVQFVHILRAALR